MTEINKAIEALGDAVTGKPEKLDVALKKGELKKMITEEVELIGREKDVEEITKKLQLGTNPIVPIVGIDGSGKTRLAKEVSKKFESKVWLEIGESFDLPLIESKIWSNINFSKEGHGGKCLIVLDDLKNVDSDTWSKFKKRNTGGSGCSVLITTPNVLVARATGTVSPHTLRGLNEDHSWSLFKKIASSDDEFDAKYVGDWKMILDKCSGVPLVIKCLGKFWKQLKSQEISKPERSIEEEFFQKIAMEYYGELSLPLKRCFAFCSLFPQDYVIDVEWLIKLWLGERFILSRISSSRESEGVGHSSSSQKTKDSSSSQGPEDIANEYLKEFLQRSIFQDPEYDDLGKMASCKIHPLMHELAKYVSGNESLTMDRDGRKVKGPVYHVSFDFNLRVSTEIPDALFNTAKDLKSILLPAPTQLGPSHDMMTRTTWDKIIQNFRRLCVLDLRNLGMKTVPSSISNLKDLTYLDLSKNDIEKLPSIAELVHLQILRLSQCYLLKELPKGLEKLTKLRHLEIDGCLAVTHMPQGIKNLASIRTLSLFVGSDSNHAGGLGELATLNNLSGKLEISHLERCHKSEAGIGEAILKKKENLERLVLRWDQDYDLDSENKDNSQESNLENLDQKLLDSIEPHSKLKVLFVMGYGGKGFLSWLSSLKDLVKLSLYNCRKCTSLPYLDELFSLEILEIQKWDSIGYIGVDSAGNASSSSSAGNDENSFRSLKKVTITDCPKLVRWKTKKVGSFPHISELEIRHCPKLTAMPLYPSLCDKLVLVSSCVDTLVNTIKSGSSDKSAPPLSDLKSMLIAGVDGPRPQEEWLKNFTSLQHLHIRKCHLMRKLPNGFNHLHSLERLTIDDCKELDLHASSDRWKSLNGKLRTFIVREVPKLNSLPKGLQSVSSLEYLGIHGCQGLKSLSKIDKLTSLKELVITECYKLASLPEEIKDLKSLKKLTTKDCPGLWPRVQEDSGDDWPKIKNIIEKDISLT